MPFEHLIEHDNHLVVIKGSGEGSLKEIYDSARRLFGDQSIGMDYRLMIVAEETSFDPNPEEMLIVVSLLKAARSRMTGRMAIVTTRPGRVTSATLIAFAADAENVRHFHSESEARNWLLGIPAAAQIEYETPC